MTRAHPHRQVNVKLDIVDDADVIGRITSQASMVDYVRDLVRRDIRQDEPSHKTHAVIVSDESTDNATGHCECELCGCSIDPWDRFCRHCGAEVSDR